MIYPNYRREQSLRRRGFRRVAGVDEAGRGSWAGPIVAAAVILNPSIKINGIKDSKLLRPLKRAKLFDRIVTDCSAWAVAAVNQKTIDRFGIVAANKKAMRDALARLDVSPDYIITDALPIVFGGVPVLAVIDGDYKIKSVAAASIIAKVTRDRMMATLDDDFPVYGFKRHKGYGTAYHFQMLKRYGVSRAHRQTFEPMRSFLSRRSIRVKSALYEPRPPRYNNFNQLTS